MPVSTINPEFTTERFLSLLLIPAGLININASIKSNVPVII